MSELLISKKTFNFTYPQTLDGLEKAKGKDKIGSTLKGIGPTYMDKTGRNGLRVGDISSTQFQREIRKIKKRNIFKFLIFMILNMS